MDEIGRLRQHLCDFAEALPEAHVDFPWGERVVKVRSKIFLFLGSDDPSGEAGIAVKLRDGHDEAMATPGARPTGYGMGRAGWVSIPLGDSRPPDAELDRWVVESYRTIAPKALVREVDESGRPGAAKAGRTGGLLAGQASSAKRPGVRSRCSKT